MNPNKLFFSQTILDGLITEGKIKLDKNVLTLLSRGNPSFVLEPAYRILKTADNGPPSRPCRADPIREGVESGERGDLP